MTNKTLYELLTDVRLTLSDVLTPSNPAGIWTQEKLIEWVLNAIASISTYVPRTATLTITCVAGQYSYDLPSDFKAMLSVEYPSGRNPPVYISPASPQSLAFASSPSLYAVIPSRLTPVNSLMLSAAPAAGESIQITYTATHLTNIYTDIEGITRQNPCVVTWTDHPLTSNDYIDIRGITLPSWTALNGKYQVTVKTADTFTVPVDSSGFTLEYAPSKDVGKIYATSSLPSSLYELLMVYISWCASRERLNLSAQSPDSSTLLLSQYAANADRLWRNYTEIANRMARHAAQSGPINSSWTMDLNDRIY